MLDNYDPNIRQGNHTLRIKLQQWDYVGNIETSIGGNCKGASVMNDIADTILYADEKWITSDCNFKVLDEDDEGEQWFSVDLKNPSGDILNLEEEAKDLENMIVCVEIVRFEATNP